MTSPDTIHIQAATSAHAPAIVSFNQKLAAETEGIALDPERLRHGVDAVLADSKRGRYWVAVDAQGNALGCCMVTVEWSDWRNGEMWWFQSVYVRPEYRQRGVFSRLFRQVESQARREAAALRLYVEQHNHSARAIYEHLGMKRAPYDVLEIDFVIGRPDGASTPAPNP